MPDVLEDIAANDAAVLGGWAALFNETAPRLDALPADKRARELLTLARAFTRRAAWAADTADGWWEEFHARLRIGMSSLRMRPLLDGGRELCRTCLSVIEIAGDLWRLAEGAGAHADEVRDAEAVLAPVRQRLVAVENTLAPLAKRVAPRTPEMIVNLFERAEAERRASQVLTWEQALAAIRGAE